MSGDIPFTQKYKLDPRFIHLLTEQCAKSGHCGSCEFHDIYCFNLHIYTQSGERTTLNLKMNYHDYEGDDIESKKKEDEE